MSFAGFYTEDEPKKVEANMYVYLKKGGGGGGWDKGRSHHEFTNNNFAFH